MNSSTRRNSSSYDDMTPIHNSTMRPSSRRGTTARNNTTMSTFRNQNANGAAMHNDMVCLCFKSPPVMMNKMPSSSNGCNCNCHMDRMRNNMDISGIEPMDSTYNMSRSRQSKVSMLQELEETMKDLSLSNDFEETILEVQDDPTNAVPLGRFYRVNSFR